MMLVLDDLHWAEKPSLLLLEFMARRVAKTNILVVGTYRDAELTGEHPLSDTLAQLYRSPEFQSTVLGGLESTDVGPFLQAASVNEASQELAQRQSIPSPPPQKRGPRTTHDAGAGRPALGRKTLTLAAGIHG